MKRPKTERRCKAKEYCVKWKSGTWGQCDRSCSQTRIISCRERHTKKRLPDAKCENLEKPKNKRGCNKCVGGKFRTSAWSPCPATCKEISSNLYQYRKIECVNSQTGEIMHHNGCRGIQRPPVKQLCQERLHESQEDLTHSLILPPLKNTILQEHSRHETSS